ncbi:MAG: hypothetical protein LBH18_02705 [Spirochaetaceae bacterium]|jgi:hypothetical protein|nr:hypothetical protein [Spirochaetaceae bacterium]
MPIFNIRRAGKFNGAALLMAFACLAPLVILAVSTAPETARAAGDYIILITGDQVRDRLVVEKLETAGIKNVLSESSQWFFMNDFSELKRVPLDEFHDFMLESDPRNDGYAEKLRTIFTREGRRYFYIPHQSLHSSDPSVIERRVKDALDNEPNIAVVFNSYYGRYSNMAPVFAAAALFSLALSVYAAKPFGGFRSVLTLPLQTAALLPSCALAVAPGAAGFSLAAILMTLFSMFRLRLKSFFVKTRLLGEEIFSISELIHLKQSLAKEKKTLLVVSALFFTVCLTANINIFYALLAALFFCVSAIISIYMDTLPRGASAHIRFVPVDIHRKVKHSLPFIALPFTLASLVSLAIPLFARPYARPLNLNIKNEIFVTAKDYENHVEFQMNFAYRKLSGGTTSVDAPYLDFELAPDGLLRTVDGGTLSTRIFSIPVAEIPPFPLKKLLDFFDARTVSLPALFDMRGLIAVIIAMSIYLPYAAFAVPGNGKKKKNKLYIRERITI